MALTACLDRWSNVIVQSLSELLTALQEACSSGSGGLRCLVGWFAVTLFNSDHSPACKGQEIKVKSEPARTRGIRLSN